MIAGLHGTLESRGANWAIIKVGGVSIQVYMPASTLSTLGAIGAEVHLHTHLHFKEDNLALYGFASQQELELFQMLIGVTGVGPKASLAMLSAMNANDLALAIATGNVDLLDQVPGIGKKMASRLVLELKGKLESVGVGAAVLGEGNAEVIAALVSLGYSPSEAASAVAAISDSPDLAIEDRIRLALQHFAAR
ncbi:MAG: Holliday junction branch migration protein RuvA [Dehalococcoidia bacterium]|jgi:Holliday junction DNA helicase RuvA|nr:Holliday junction branch migration protein RuvA [Dehalococcoidia bacterium]